MSRTFGKFGSFESLFVLYFSFDSHLGMTALRWVGEMIEVYFYSEGASEHGQKEYAHEVGRSASEWSRHSGAQRAAEYCPVGCRLTPTQQAKLEVLILLGYVSPNVLLDQCAEVDGGLIPGLALATNMVAAPGGQLTRRVGKCDSRMELAAAMSLARRCLGAPVDPEFAARALMGPQAAQWLANLAACNLEGKYQTALQKMTSEYRSELQEWISRFASPTCGEDHWRAALATHNNAMHGIAKSASMQLDDESAQINARISASDKAIGDVRIGLNKYAGIVHLGHVIQIPARVRNAARLASTRALAELRGLTDLLASPDVNAKLEMAQTSFDSSQDVLALLDISRGFVETMVAAQAPVIIAQSAPVIAQAPVIIAQSAPDIIAQSAPVIAQAANTAAQAAPDMRGVLADLVALLEQLRGQLAAGK
jgi:hypothetical protein